jgi:hypothetical protein
MRVVIAIGALLALAVIGATYSGDSNGNTEGKPTQPQNKSLIIFNAIKSKGIAVEDAYTTNGSEIKKAFGLEDSHIASDATIAFVIFSYRTQDGVEKKVGLTLDAIYTAFQAEPSVDGVLVMPYDPSRLSLGVGPNMIYTNRSYAQELALQGLPPVTHYNKLEIYTVLSEVDEG